LICSDTTDPFHRFYLFNHWSDFREPPQTSITGILKSLSSTDDR
jgi:hypothetical protein